MTNTNKHHFERRVFLRQAHPTIGESLSTAIPVPAASRTNGPGNAGSPRLLTLAADQTGTSRDPARPPAAQTEEWPIHSTRKQARQTISKETRANTTRTNTVPNTQTSGPTSGRGALANPDTPHSSSLQLQRPLGGVRQDKARLESARTASRQPARDTYVSRAPLTNNGVVRSQPVAGKQKLVQVTLWVDPAVKAHLERRAREEGLALSPSGAAFLRKAVQQDIDLQYSALLRPIIEDAIAKQMAGIATRLTWLLVRIAFDAGQTRSLVTNILGRQQGVTQPLLKTILEGSGRSAKANIMRRTPQITELINSVEQWMTEDK